MIRQNKVRRGNLWDPPEMGTGWQGRLPQVFCCRAGDETGRLDLRNRGERELQATYLVFW